MDLDPSNPKHRALSRLILARRDIDEACRVVQHVVNRISSEHDSLLEPLTCAAVIYYARPFIGSRHYPALPDKFARFDCASMKRSHDGLINFRNTCVAHRDADENRVTLVPKGGEVTWADGAGKAIVCEIGDCLDSRHMSLQSFPSFLELCQYQIDRLNAHTKSEKDRLFR